MKFRKLTRYKFLLRLTAIFVLLSVVPLTILSFVINGNSKQTLETQLYQLSHENLDQTAASINTMFSQLTRFTSNFSLAGGFTEFSQIRNGHYYEYLSGEIPEEDTQNLYDYLYKKSSVVQLLYLIASSNDCLHSVFYVDTDKDLVLTSYGSQYNMEQFRKLGLVDVNAYSPNRSYTTNQPINFQTWGLRETVILPYIYPRSNGAYLIINFNMNRTYNTFMSGQSGSNNIQLLGINSTDYFYDSGIPFADQAAEQLRLRGGEIRDSEKVVLEDGTTFLAMKQYLPNCGWTLYNLINMKQAYLTLEAARSVNLMLSALLLLLTLAFGIYESRRFYRPVNELVQLVESRVDSKKPYPDELTLLKDALSQKYSNASIPADILGERLLTYQEQFLKLLLEERLEPEKIHSGFEYFSLELDPEDISLIVVSLSGGDPGGCTHSKYIMLNDLRRIGLEWGKCLVFSPSRNLYSNQSGLEVAAQQIREEIDADFDETCIVMSSALRESAANLNTVYHALLTSLEKVREDGLNVSMAGSIPLPSGPEEEKKESPSREKLYVQRVMELIQENCGADVTLSEIADSLEINPTYLSRIFRSITGCTFISYLTGVRMERAKTMLLAGEKLETISNTLGYSNANYFIKIFRRYEGFTPGEYRSHHLLNPLQDRGHAD